LRGAVEEFGFWEPKSRELGALKSLLEREHEAQETSREALQERPVEERVAAGTAIEGAVYAGTEKDSGETLYVFTCAKNESRLRPGTRVRLSRGDAHGAVARLELVDDRRHEGRYILRLAGRVKDEAALEGSEPWVLDEDELDLLDIELAILGRAEKEGLDVWLAGAEGAAEGGAGPQGGETSSPLAEGLTDSMKEAFERGVRAGKYFAVQGPPGSGKTHLLARLALHFALTEDARVLITAVSHQAIHNALGETYWVAGRFSKSGPVSEAAADLRADGFLKLGASRGKNEGLPAGVRPTPSLPRQKRPLIVGATLYSAFQHAFSASGPLFDVVLFDEAGQAPLVLALAARLTAPKVVFIGDDAQLPPVRNLPPDEDMDPLGRMSALEFIRRRYGDPFLLRETRRLNRELCSVISDCFYGGRLAPTPEAEGRLLRLSKPPAAPFAEILDPARSLVFVDVPHEGRRSTSEEEARWAAALALEAMRCGLPPQELGIIAPYRAQCNRVRFLFGRRRAPLCSTVERFQGQEREMVVVSLTSSEPRYLARLAAFLFDPNRLNVAVSRARVKAVLLGSRRALGRAVEAADPDSAGAEGLAAFRRILAACHVVTVSKFPSASGDPTGPSDVAPEAAGEGEAPAPAGAVFEPGAVVEHSRFGAGRVLSKSVLIIDNRKEWANEVRFRDGTVRIVVPRLSDPPMKGLE